MKDQVEELQDSIRSVSGELKSDRFAIKNMGNETLVYEISTGRSYNCPLFSLREVVEALNIFCK